jgi:hypothetical protein
MLAGLQVLVSVQIIDHLVERIDLPRLQIGTAMAIAKGGRFEGQALQAHRDLRVPDIVDNA